MRRAPSSRITSPLSSGLAMIASTSMRVLLGAAEPRRVRHLRLQDRLGLPRQAGHHRGLHHPGSDGHHPDRLVGQVAGRGQGQRDDAALAGRVRRLTDLPVVRRDARRHDHQTAVAVERLVVDHGLGGQPQHVEGADQVDLDHRAEGLQRQQPALADHPARRGHPGAVDRDPQRPEAGRRVDRRPDLLLVADVGGDEPHPSPSPAASSAPGEDGRSMITTCAPGGQPGPYGRAPSPDAPPVTRTTS